MKIEQDFSLKRFNTFSIDVKSKYYASLKTNEEIAELFNSKVFNENPYFILGGGSNILFKDDYEGLIIQIEQNGLIKIDDFDNKFLIEVSAGHNWHEFVAYCLKNNLYGLENLALIPGKVGAAPVQNIGAYGIEQKDYFYSLKGFDLQNKTFTELNKDDCKFGYRDSIFKHELKDRFIITSVKYKLDKSFRPNLSYKELDDEIKKSDNPTNPQSIFETVIKLRQSKLPDPKILGNAGSFFKNPIISEKSFEELKSKYSNIKGFEIQSGDYKLSAAWMIESNGWKGKRLGDAGVYEKHALILINYGNAKASDILELSDKISQSVYDKFNVILEKEVIVI
jgi:UDP-N-acetylmuramate dehydrogenase